MTSSPPGKRWHTREDSGIRLDRMLRWWHDGEPIDHPKIIEAFNTGLAPTDDGRFRLSIGADWCYVEVEAAAYAVIAIDAAPTRLSVRLSDRTAEWLDSGTLQLASDGVLECRVKGGRARARFSRDAQFALGSLIDEQGGQLFLQLEGARLPLPLAPAALSTP